MRRMRAGAPSAAFALGLLALVALASCGPDQRAEEHGARLFVFQKLSTPAASVVVGPAVLQSSFAVVDWTRGGLAGGRALLRRERDGWAFLACGGAPMKQRPTLERAGVPDGVAGVLATKLVGEESRLTGGRREQIEQWRGLGAPGVACPEPR